MVEFANPPAIIKELGFPITDDAHVISFQFIFCLCKDDALQLSVMLYQSILEFYFFYQLVLKLQISKCMVVKVNRVFNCTICIWLLHIRLSKLPLKYQQTNASSTFWEHFSIFLGLRIWLYENRANYKFRINQSRGTFYRWSFKVNYDGEGRGGYR